MILLSYVQLEMHLPPPQKRMQNPSVMFTFLLDILLLTYYDVKFTKCLKYCGIELIYLMLYDKDIREKKTRTLSRYKYIYANIFIIK